MGYAIMRIDKVKSISDGNARIKHNRREVQCLTSNPDKKNIRLNLSESMRCDSSRTFKEMFEKRTKGQKIRKNAVYAIEVILTFSPEAISEQNLFPWAKDNANWLRKIFGEDNIVDCQLHLDEKTPHIHALVIPIDDKGKLNARAFVGGSRNRLVELQTDYSEAMKCHGLSRGICREITKARHESYVRWMARQAEKEERLRGYERAFNGNAVKG